MGIGLDYINKTGPPSCELYSECSSPSPSVNLAHKRNTCCELSLCHGSTAGDSVGLVNQQNLLHKQNSYGNPDHSQTVQNISYLKS